MCIHALCAQSVADGSEEFGYLCLIGSMYGRDSIVNETLGVEIWESWRSLCFMRGSIDCEYTLMSKRSSLTPHYYSPTFRFSLLSFNFQVPAARFAALTFNDQDQTPSS